MKSTAKLSIQTDYTEQLKQYFESIYFLDSLPDYRRFVEEYLYTAEPWQVTLALNACEAAGGIPEQALPVAGAWSILKQAAYVLDDVIDGDLPGSKIESQQKALGFFAAANFTAFRMLAFIESAQVSRQVVELFSEAGLTSTTGLVLDIMQMLDPETAEQALDRYWKIVIYKSGSIYRAATTGGAIVAGASDDYVSALAEYGNALGVIQQIVDDCRDMQAQEKSQFHEITLPALIYGMRVHEKLEWKTSYAELMHQTPQTIINKLNKKYVPQIISEILMDWRERAMQSLEILPNSTAKDTLLGNLDLILKK